MPAAKTNLLIEQGATWSHSFTVHQSAPIGTPTSALLPMDLSGYSARMQLRADVSSPAVLIELSIINGRIVIQPLSGRLDLEINATDSAALAFDRAVYDLEIQSPSGRVTRLVQGSVVLLPEVTR